MSRAFTCVFLLGLLTILLTSAAWSADSPVAVEIVAPENGCVAQVGQVLDVFTVVTGAESISAVAVTCNGRGVGMASEEPYEFEWDTSGLSPGQYMLRASAFLKSGEAVNSDTVSVTLEGAETTEEAGAVTPRPEYEPAPEPPPSMSGSNWGLGLGVPYGVLGANFETGDRTRFSGGLGYAVVGLGWNVGVKHYFRPLSEGQGSMSLSAYYGTNTYIQKWGDDELQNGFSVGLGWTRGHFDIGLLLPFVSDIPEGGEEQGPRVKLYLGYRFGSTGPSEPQPRRAAEPAPSAERQPPPDWKPKTDW